MKKEEFYAIVLMLFIPICMHAKEQINPTITPVLFQYNSQITVVYDVTGTPLASLTDTYAWVWIPGKSISSKYNITPASSDPTKTANAKFVKSVVAGRTLFTLIFTPSSFFGSDISAETQMGILLKGNDWSNGQTTDYFANFGFQVEITKPAGSIIFVDNNEQIAIEAKTAVAADYELFVNDVSIDQASNKTTYTYTHTVTETSGFSIVRIVATQGANTSEASFQYNISVASPTSTRPPGIIAGINYNNGDHSKATLCLWAPGKSSVYVRGDFNEWRTGPEDVMNRDGEYFWKEITGLTSGVEYGFQYLVNESVFVADPYADKILDPDDQYIPDAVYPNLKEFPQQIKSDTWYFNRVSVLQTGQTAYTWQVTNFEKPVKEKLVVYELLIRDFFDAENRSYQNLIDTISYFKGLGVNAVELMPIMEFNGNDSWGYNPAFMFAPDKYYGPKNKLKEFVDKCHQEGIAVILDIAMNHQDLPNTYVMMDFDFTEGQMKPTTNNKWFNITATHPFSVFFDMNHESAYTKKYLDTVNYYWLNEYKVDGYRFDLSKGFTQKNNPNNVGVWSEYDNTRIAILKRMADKIWEHTPDAYVILEHLSVNSEEKELAEYRAGEGKGMMLWGKMTDPYNQNTMGFAENSDISSVYHGHSTRGWSTPHLVGYMESHDEERLMVKNTLYGNSSGNYNVKNLNTGLSRVKAASVLFYLVPGPKMLWQFGELGYDFSINYCPDGSIDSDCRVAAKPVHWEYLEVPSRAGLRRHVADLIRLKDEYDVFSEGTATFSSGSSLVKQITLKNVPYTALPVNTSDMNAVLVANFDVVEKNVTVEVPHAGTWFDYYMSGTPLSATSTSLSVTLRAGAYKIFTDVQLEEYPITSINEVGEGLALQVYPNPSRGEFVIKLKQQVPIKFIMIFDLRGVPQRFKVEQNTINVSELPAGLYLLKVTDQNGKLTSQKLVKE